MPAAGGLSFVLGLTAGLLLAASVARWQLKSLTVENYRGRQVKVAGGIVIVLALIVIQLIALGVGAVVPARPPGTPFTGFVFDWAAVLGSLNRTHMGLLVLVLGFFCLGLLDDVAGDRYNKGFAGHVKALLKGKITTGSLKAFGGAALAFAVATWWEGSLPAGLLGGAVIALSANLVNLLDLRPGRALKVFLPAWLVLALIWVSSVYLLVSTAVAGAAVAWMPADLREKGMLGDSGANMLGAILGAGVVLSIGVAGRVVILAALVALTLASERWSFTAAIEKFAPLRWLDGLGRL
ncbi:MAG: hypothetical protein WD627_10790 [Actinomycetota bacterium]